MQLWSLPETAETTRASIAFWRKVVYLKHIPVVRVGRLVRLNSEDVLAYLAARTSPAVKTGPSGSLERIASRISRVSSREKTPARAPA